MTIDDLPSLLHDFLGRVPTLSLATIDAAGHPHASNLNFVADDELNLLFLSRPDSEHSRHIAAHPQVAVTAYGPFCSPAEIHGLQLHGSCEVQEASAFEATWRRFCGKHSGADAFEEVARREHSFYRIRPHWIRWIDNRVRFGFKLETRWPPT